VGGERWLIIHMLQLVTLASNIFVVLVPRIVNPCMCMRGYCRRGEGGGREMVDHSYVAARNSSIEYIRCASASNSESLHVSTRVL